jgi:hypothetical protein
MSWSTEQIHQIVEQFWQNGVVRCPDDNGPLKLKLHKLAGGDYALHAECPFCGKRKEFRRGDDPQRHLFRRWTTDEIQRLDRSTREQSASPCPVCNAPVQKDSISSLSVIRCFRCGNSDQWQHVTDAPIIDPVTATAPA